MPHLAILVAFLVTLAPARASASDAPDRSAKQGKGHVVGKWAYDRLSRAHKAIARKRHTEALEILETMKRKRRLNAHERALMWQTFAFTFSSQQRYPAAIDAFERCLALDAMPAGATREMRYNLGQLQIATRQYQRGIATLKAWLAGVQNPSPAALDLLSLAHVQIEDYRAALHYAKRSHDRRKRRPSEQELQYLLSLQFRLGQHWEVVKTLERLVARHPKRTYYLQLASTLSELEKHRRALAVLEIAYVQGVLVKHGELVSLASRYLQQGIPHLAAEVLERGLERGQIRAEVTPLSMLAEAHMHARDTKRAISPLERAAELSAGGELILRLARIHLDRREWDAAARAARRAIKRTPAEQRGHAYFLLGQAQYEAGRHAAALTTFRKAASHESVARSATLWIKKVRFATQQQKQQTSPHPAGRAASRPPM